jgi:hypothetical protein
MKILRGSFILVFISICLVVTGQSAFNSERFFLNEKPLVLKLTTDMRRLIKEKDTDDLTQKAIVTCTLPDNSVLSEEITLTVRGHMRRSICNIPPVKLNFKSSSSPKLASLKNLKLVAVCRGGNYDAQLLWKEFLCYKIFNLLTDQSFRVRQVNLTYADSKNDKKPIVQDAFFIENIDVMAKRNNCKEIPESTISPESAERKQMTLVNLFEFMIGNTDWSVPNNHNIKLIKPKKDSLTRVIPVPYDFDYSGMVNADYAIPDPIMNQTSVVTRVYRGFPRTMEELQVAIHVFNQKKEGIYSVIKNFAPLSASNKKEMTRYLDDFYEIINNPKDVKYYFIDNARTK